MRDTQFTNPRADTHSIVLTKGLSCFLLVCKIACAVYRLPLVLIDSICVSFDNTRMTAPDHKFLDTTTTLCGLEFSKEILVVRHDAFLAKYLTQNLAGRLREDSNWVRAQATQV